MNDIVRNIDFYTDERRLKADNQHNNLRKIALICVSGQADFV